MLGGAFVHFSPETPLGWAVIMRFFFLPLSLTGLALPPPFFSLEVLLSNVSRTFVHVCKMEGREDGILKRDRKSSSSVSSPSNFCLLISFLTCQSFLHTHTHTHRESIIIPFYVFESLREGALWFFSFILFYSLLFLFILLLSFSFFFRSAYIISRRRLWEDGRGGGRRPDIWFQVDFKSRRFESEEEEEETKFSFSFFSFPPSVHLHI
jgi:hypothetical protein